MSDDQPKIDGEPKTDEQKIEAEQKVDAKRITDGHQGMNEMLQKLVDEDVTPDEPQWWRGLAALRDIKSTPKEDTEPPAISDQG